MQHIPYCPHRNNKPADECIWCATERGDDPFGNIPRLLDAGKSAPLEEEDHG